MSKPCITRLDCISQDFEPKKRGGMWRMPVVWAVSGPYTLHGLQQKGDGPVHG